MLVSKSAIKLILFDTEISKQLVLFSVCKKAGIFFPYLHISKFGENVHFE